MFKIPLRNEDPPLSDVQIVFTQLSLFSFTGYLYGTCTQEGSALNAHIKYYVPEQNPETAERLASLFDAPLCAEGRPAFSNPACGDKALAPSSSSFVRDRGARQAGASRDCPLWAGFTRREGCGRAPRNLPPGEFWARKEGSGWTWQRAPQHTCIRSCFSFSPELMAFLMDFSSVRMALASLSS